MLEIRIVLLSNIISNMPTKTVVNVEPTKVLTAISLPKTTNAAISKDKLIITKIAPGENGIYALSITEIPLVPPSKSECGNIKTTVAIAYKMLPKIINP